MYVYSELYDYSKLLITVSISVSKCYSTILFHIKYRAYFVLQQPNIIAQYYLKNVNLTNWHFKNLRKSQKSWHIYCTILLFSMWLWGPSINDVADFWPFLTPPPFKSTHIETSPIFHFRPHCKIFFENVTHFSMRWN